MVASRKQLVPSSPAPEPYITFHYSSPPEALSRSPSKNSSIFHPSLLSARKVLRHRRIPTFSCLVQDSRRHREEEKVRQVCCKEHSIYSTHLTFKYEQDTNILSLVQVIIVQKQEMIGAIFLERSMHKSLSFFIQIAAALAIFVVVNHIFLFSYIIHLFLFILKLPSIGNSIAGGVSRKW